MNVMDKGTRLPKSSPDGPTIPIAVSGGEGHVWEIQDVKRLRCDHHICGILTGTLPQLSQQNVFLGLPLRLLPEEVVLLVENGIATLIDDEAAHRPPTLEEADQALRARADDIDIQKRQAWRVQQQKKAWVREKFGAEIAAARERKKQKQQAKKAAEIAAGTGLEGGVSDPLAEDAPVVEPSQDAETAAEPTQEQLDGMTHYVGIAHRSDPKRSPFYEPLLHEYETVESARAAGLWTFPLTLRDRARCGVFRKLWEQGKFLGRGIKFGCDFLVYPGETLRYHSHFACTVVPSPSAPINPLDLVAFGRLATAVKKAHLLAAWDDEAGEVTMMSMEWAGMG